MNAEPTAQSLWDRLSDRSRQLCTAVARRAAGRDEQAYLVGGSVRDLLLGAAEVDLDIVTEGDASGLASALSDDLRGEMQGPSEFLTAAVELPDGRRIDLATARQETYPAPAKLPVVEPATISEDLRRRDFSINAVALQLLPGGGGRLVDPCGGSQDSAAGLIRILHDRSFVDDPTRLIRAVRFEQRLGFAMAPPTMARFREAVERQHLRRVSGARLRDEIVKALGEPAPWRVVERLRDLGALGDVVPGALLDDTSLGWLRKVPIGLVVLRAGEGVRPVRAWPYLLGALCARGEPREAMARLPLDREAHLVVETMGRAARLPRPPVLTRRTCPGDVELDRELGSRLRGELLVHWLTTAPRGKRRLERATGALRGVATDVTGDQLVAHGAPRGPAIGVGLRAARAAKLAGIRGGAPQLAVALDAVRHWQRPPRRKRRRADAGVTEGTR